MSNNEPSILTPSPSQIERCVRDYEKEEGFTDLLIYRECLKEMRKIELREISEESIGQVVRTFLRNWGLMGRVINRSNGWEGRLAESIRSNYQTFEHLRTLNLKDTELSEVEGDIKACYQPIRNALGPSCAAKTLHLISPDFFPLWDAAIRKEIDKETSLKKGPIGDSAAGYYEFMVRMREFLGDYGETLSKLSKEYGWTELKIIDEYLLKISRKSASH